MTTDLTKPVQIADGRKARVICTDRVGSPWPVMALITNEDGTEWDYRYNLAGKSASDRGLDLINIDTTPKNLRIAREAVAQLWKELGYGVAAKSYRDGKQDNCTEIRAILKALEMVA